MSSLLTVSERVNRAWQNLIAAADRIHRSADDVSAARHYGTEFGRAVLEASRAEELSAYEAEIMRADAEALLDLATPLERILARLPALLAKYASFERLPARIRRALSEASARAGLN